MLSCSIDPVCGHIQLIQVIDICSLTSNCILYISSQLQSAYSMLFITA